MFENQKGRQASRTVFLCGINDIAMAMVSLVFLFAVASSPSFADNASQRFDIPAGDLQSALLNFSQAVDLQLLYPADITAGLTTQGVQGEHSPEEALRRLLAGTGLDYRLTSENSVTLQRIAVPQENAPLALNAITVTGDLLGGATDGLIVRRSAGTALFGDSDVRDLPFAINIVGEHEIRNRQATTFVGALAADPSISSVFGADDGHIFEALQVRGFPVSNMIYDGSLIEAYYTSRKLETIDRIEVLRGPAAFRYGFIQPGGSVNVVSKQPMEEPFTSVTTSVTDYGRLGFHLDTGGRVGDEKQFGYRLNVAASGREVYFDDSTKERQVIGLATDYRLTPDATLYLGYEYANVEGDGGGMTGYRQIVGDTSGKLPDPIPDPTHQWLPDWDYGDATEQTVKARLKWHFLNDWVLDSSFRYHRKDEEVYGGSAFGAWEANGDHTLSNYGYIWEPETISNTTFLQGDVQTGPVKHNLTIGATYTEIEVHAQDSANSFTQNISSNYFNPVELPYIAPEWVKGNNPKTRQRGVFFSNKMHIGRWHPLIGVRWSEIKTAADNFNPETGRNDKITPMFGLTYDLTESTALFASYAQGLENGGFAPAGTSNALQNMPALETESVEVGFKSDFANGAATLDASLFRIEKTAAFTDSSNAFVQNGKQIHQGLEIIAKGHFWEPLEINSGIQYIDAKFEDDPSTEGSTPINLPALRAILSVEYAFESVPGLFISGLVDYTGERELTVPNTHKADEYVRLDLGTRYETRINNYDLIARFNVDNVTDERYWATVGWGAGTTPFAEFGAPRTFKLSLEVKY